MSRKGAPKHTTPVGTEKKATFADLGATEQSVMVQLVQGRSSNMTMLAADLWRTRPEWNAFNPWPLLAYVLDSLSSRNLVKFRLINPSGWSREEAVDIRLTPDGWAMMGFPNKVIEVGTRSRHQAAPEHRRDGTNYRNQPFKAIGGAIETDTFAEHKQLFPQHTHMYGDNLVTATDSDTRPYTRVTPEMEATIIHTRETLGPVAYSDIAEVAGVPERTVKYVLVDLPRLRRINAGEEKVEGSLRRRIMAAVSGVGMVKDVAELRRILGMADDEHNVVHVLHALHGAGKLDFTERGNGMGTATVINIRLHKKGKKNGDDIVNAGIPFDQPEQAEPMPVVSRQQYEQELSAKAAEVELPPKARDVSDMAPEEGYPLLVALLDRERNREDSDTKAYAYISAAEVLKDVDPTLYQEMLDKAHELNVTYPSPLEREYIRYVAAHPEAAGPDVQAQETGD